MSEMIYDPLEEFRSTFAPRFHDICEQTFGQLASEAGVDLASNRETCRKLYAAEHQLDDIVSRISRRRVLSVLLWVAALGCLLAAIVMFRSLEVWLLALLFAAAAGIIVILFARVYPRSRLVKTQRDEVCQQADALRQEARAQMSPLNRLFDWDLFSRMAGRALPNLEFDPYFTTQRLADLKAVYGWSDDFNSGRSVIYSQSGLIRGNPFVVCRTRSMVAGTKTYHGSRTITWTETQRGSDGKLHTVHRSQVLHAEITRFCPFYPEETRLIYGNIAAPDLRFSRRHSGLAGRKRSVKYKSTLRQLRRLNNDLEHANYAMLTNEDFEVSFDTRDRTDNVQFAMLFDALAQQNMLALLKDGSVGYGDDFDFYKHQMINTIVSEHLQSMQFDMDPEQFVGLDCDKARDNFMSANTEYFRALYFALAPLLCVSPYQTIRPVSSIYGRDMRQESSFWEHEALANAWGEDRFKAPDCVTDSILKTSQQRNADGSSTLYVTSYGYRTEPRTEYVSVWGGDGRMHRVPVEWEEYLPVEGSGRIRMMEDNQPLPADATPTDRLNHVQDLLSRSGLQRYRRHIASSLQ